MLAFKYHYLLLLLFPQTGSQTVARKPFSQWAVKVDVNALVEEFERRVPNMAHTVCDTHIDGKF